MATDIEVSETRVRRTRPKDRADRIIQVATRLFCERGYNAVSLDDIAQVVGITAPAVYRHFESKEFLLAAVVERLVDRYRTTWSEVMARGGTAHERLEALSRALIGPQVDERHFWPLALAELRHLPKESIRSIRRNADKGRQLWIDLVLEMHPALSLKEAELMVDVGGGVSSSLLFYQPQLSKRRLLDILTRMHVASYSHDPMARVGRFASEGPRPAPAGPLPGAPLRTSARERILAQAIPMFRRHGFSGIGIDDVAKAAGFTGPAVYNHFRNKEAILFAALARMNEQLAVSVGRSLAGTQSASVALERLIESYLDLAIEEPDLLGLYWSQKHALSDEQAEGIARGERSYIDDWIGVLRHDRRDLSETEARTVVYAALGLMNGLWQAHIALPVEQARAVLRGMVYNALVHV